MCKILTYWLKYKLWCSLIGRSFVSFTFLNHSDVNEVDKITETPSSVTRRDSTAAQSASSSSSDDDPSAESTFVTNSFDTITMEDLSQFSIRLFPAHTFLVDHFVTCTFTVHLTIMSPKCKIIPERFNKAVKSCLIVV